MGLPETLSIVLGAALLMALVLGVLLRGGRTTVNPAEAARLAVLEATHAETLAALERTRTGAAETAAELAAARQEVTGLKAAAAELQARLAELGVQHRDVADRLERLRVDKAAGDETAAANSVALRKGDEQVEELRAQLAHAVTRLDAATADAARLGAANATLRESLDQQGRQSEEKLALLAGAREAMGLQFRSLAEEVMARHGESFTRLNKEQMEGVLTPLREKLGEFELRVNASHTESVRERATLAEQIRAIAETGAAMGKETRELTEALRGRSQTQGAWGEMVLATVLQRSGLREGEEYQVQQSFTDEDGRRLRPDVIVSMPGDGRMVVDAKVSLTAFEALVNAATEEERAQHLPRHLGSVRTHIATLGSKEYHAATGSTFDYVVMFVPIEGALAAALQADPTLVSFAAERNVALTTPTTLIMALRTIANVWQVERRNKNAEDIANRAGLLYDKFSGFVTDMTAIGDGIGRVRQTYDKAMGKLSTGGGNLLRQAELLKQLGGRTSKSLPAALLDASDGQVTLALTTHTTATEVTVERTTEMLLTGPAAPGPAPEDAE